ncbi:MAG: FliA/WhiG family RNA polymerase sigma factor [Oscillospiraceae bacterium]|nr:FliA/WhiG family RNA polymerase sigma factor [Oscillospiraceae bacterium]
MTDLFHKYTTTRDVGVRNEIVLQHMNMVSKTAVVLRNMYAKGFEVEDLVNEGMLALISAVESFEPGRGVKFETYATIKIKGAIIDYIRKQDWIPRSVRKFGRRLEEAYGVLYNRLERTPTNAELAEELELTEEKFEKMLADTANTNTLSFEELLYEDNFSLFGGQSNHTTPSGGVDTRLYVQERKKMVAEAIDGLKPKEKQVVSLYYYENLKLSEIADVLGVTESRVCQIHSKCMIMLRQKLEYYIRGI